MQMQALTFDDGPYAFTSDMLDLINAAGLKVVRIWQI
jgi:hypothetical protein